MTATAPDIGSIPPSASAAAWLPEGTSQKTSPFERAPTTPSRSAALPSSIRRSASEPRPTTAASKAAPGASRAFAAGLPLATEVTATCPSAVATCSPE